MKNSLITADHKLPYNPKLTERARELRKNMTKAEKHFWFNVIKTPDFKNIKFLKQRVVDHYIVDFYCPEKNLAIEIDGEIHYNQIEYDQIRTHLLKQYGLKIIRFTNNEVINQPEKVKTRLISIISSL